MLDINTHEGNVKSELQCGITSTLLGGMLCSGQQTPNAVKDQNRKNIAHSVERNMN